MSTRAMIYIRDGNVMKGIYSQCDGYPQYLGQMLKHNYKSPEKVKRLIALGAVYTVGLKLEPSELVKRFGADGQYKKEFVELKSTEQNELKIDNSYGLHTIAYKRDGNDAEIEQECYEGDFWRDMPSRKACMIAYIYIYDLKTKRWSCYDKTRKVRNTKNAERYRVTID